MIEYQVLKAENFEDLTEIVNNWIEDGWKPQGGVATGTSSMIKVEILYQAMVKEEDKE